MSRRFWPAREPSQTDYETLREAVLLGSPMECLTAARFGRRGLAGLIAWPHTEPIYIASVISTPRPPWTPYADPRLEALAASYELILASSEILALERSAS